MDEKLQKLKEMIEGSDNIVFFGGAGVSTESGIPDFRSVDGLYRQKWKYPPERIISRSFFDYNIEEFYRFYKEKMLILDAQPNAAHKVLAKLEHDGKLKAVVTQNIDGLHQLAGSEKVYELHGSIHRNYCMNCHRFYDGEFVKNSTGIPRCPKCGDAIKPDVVLYEESLDNETLLGAINAIMAADMLIIGGTSLTVYPAAGLIEYYTGKKLVIINRTVTPQDDRADLVVQGSIGEVLSEVYQL